jgi:hypothetical protein
MTVSELPRKRESHIWQRDAEDFYVEPQWVSVRLFEVEKFIGKVVDPACGSGNIVKAARSKGLKAEGWDLIDRGLFPGTIERDFLSDRVPAADNFCCNVPFILAQPICERAVKLAKRKVAIVFPVSRVNAAHWLEALPLARQWLLTPRPSMPPYSVIARGEKREVDVWIIAGWYARLFR